MKILKVSKNVNKPSREKNIKIAAQVIRRGKIVIYPTETSYALGCDVTNREAIKKIYKIKMRDPRKPIGIIVSDLKMMKRYGHITELTRHLVEKFMPGPLTIVIKKKGAIPNVLNQREIAFRISSHPVAAKLVSLAGCPITATSANVSKQKPLYKINEVKNTFRNQVDVILDCGNLVLVKNSTYVDATRIKILREGAIAKKEIERELKGYVGS